MSNFFRFFPITKYKFGEEETTVAFQKINAYVDLIDQVKDITTFYQVYNISEFDRPDTLSYKLYGKTTYDWTFFLLNEKLRLQGWPMSNLDLFNISKEYYPNIVLNTNHNISFTKNIKVGDTVRAFSNPSQTGVVKRINYDMGQVFIERSSFFTPSSNGYIINVNSELDINLAVPYQSQVRQYDAVHHYEQSGEFVDYLDDTAAQTSVETLQFKDTTSLTAVTYTERLINLNLEQKRINVFKPSLIEKVVAEFNRLMEQEQ